jgi:hypothetical protein
MKIVSGAMSSRLGAALPETMTAGQQLVDRVAGRAIERAKSAEPNVESPEEMNTA